MTVVIKKKREKTYKIKVGSLKRLIKLNKPLENLVNKREGIYYQ